MNRLSRKCPRNLIALWATLWLIASVAYGAPAPLTNGVPVTGLSGTIGSEVFYMITVPAGQDELEISISGTTGDCDLYVRKDAPPTTLNYDYRPYKVGSNETVTVATPAAGTWYIMLRGYSAYSGLTLVANYSASVTVALLQNGVPVTGLSGVQNSEQYFRVELPAGQSKLEIKLSGGTGDCDLYVKKDALPTTSVYDYRPFLVGNNETVTVNSPAGGTWYVMLRGYNPYSGATLLASYGGGAGAVLTNGVPVPNLAGAQASEKVYRIDVPAGQINLEIKISGGTGDCDLYVKHGAQPTVSDYDYRPFLAGNNETVTVNNPAAGTWYIMLRGYSAYTGVTLKATYGGMMTLANDVPVAGLTAPLGNATYYKIEVPSGQSHLDFKIFGGTGNCDMYIRRGAQPTLADWDFRPYQSGNNESVSIGSPLGGTWYVMLYARQAYANVTLNANYWFTGTVTLLSSGVPVTGIAGAEGSEKYYRIIVPDGQTELEIKISGGTGDADLYVKLGATPTTSDYDYRPYEIGNNETVTIANPTGGNWLIMVRGYHAYAGVTLVATFGGGGGGGGTVTTLTNGVPVSGIAAAGGTELFYKIEVPSGQTQLEIKISGGTGDADLYVRKDAKPTITTWDYRPYLIGNNETVTVNNPASGTWYVMIRGYGAFSGVTLVASYIPVPDTVIPLSNGVPVTGIAGVAGNEKFYKITVPAGQKFLHVAIAGGTGDCDLYVKKGAKPTVASWDYRPYLVGNNEVVDVTNPAAATWFIMLRSYQTYSGVTLVAEHGGGNNFATDPNCAAVWRFEAGQLTADSVGSNTLANNGVAAETGAFKEGTSSARFEADANDYMVIPDAALSAGFPLKSGDIVKKISVATWCKLDSLPARYQVRTLFGKFDESNGRRSFGLALQTDEFLQTHFVMTLGYNKGNSGRWLHLNDLVLQTGRWYHVVATYNDADKSYRIRVWDDTAQTAKERVGIADFGLSTTLNVEDAPVIIGNDSNSNHFFNGLIDEMSVFNDVLTVAEMDKIRQGMYGKP